jgi:hypothetical protein
VYSVPAGKKAKEASIYAEADHGNAAGHDGGADANASVYSHAVHSMGKGKQGTGKQGKGKQKKQQQKKKVKATAEANNVYDVGVPRARAASGNANAGDEASGWEGYDDVNSSGYHAMTPEGGEEAAYAEAARGNEATYEDLGPSSANGGKAPQESNNFYDAGVPQPKGATESSTTPGRASITAGRERSSNSTSSTGSGTTTNRRSTVAAANQCHRPSPRGGTCKNAKVSGSNFCTSHQCEHPGCDQSKSSSESACAEHQNAGFGLDAGSDFEQEC